MSPVLTRLEPVTISGEPAWLASARSAATERLAGVERPTAQLEEWRYSRVDQLEVEGRPHAPRPDLDVSASEALAAGTPASSGAAGIAVEVDGHAMSVHLDGSLAARGVRFGRAAELDLSAEHAAIFGTPGVDPFAELVAAGAPDPLVVVIPAGVVLDRPLVVRSVVGEGDGLVLSRLVVLAGADAEVRLLHWSDGGRGNPLVVSRTDVVLDPAARVSITSVQADGAGVDRVATAGATVARDATLRLTHAALGGRYARARFDCRLEGRGATGDLSALYLGDGDQMHDLRTFQDHLASDTTSHLVFKGALDDRSHAVYTGLIRVGEEARGTNAEQSNRLVKLSDDTWAESVPNLEIHNNDVRCAHASTVGPIDESQRFYLESRGIAPEVAERLVVAGFFEEVLAGFVDPVAAGAVRDMVAARLSGEGRS